MKKIALVSFIYSSASKYFSDLIASLNSQTNQNFEVIFFNDNIETPEILFQKLNLNFKIIKLNKKTPFENRIEGLKRLVALDYDFYIFQDCDDTLTSNRVETVCNLLKKYKFVVNDLDIINENSILIDSLIWKNRFSNNSLFSFENLIEYNFVGFGNSAITCDLLNYIGDPPKINFLAADWFVFFSILKNSQVNAYFTSDCATIYRQHSQNSIGIADEKKIKTILAEKKKIGSFLFNEKKVKSISENFIIPIKHKHNYPFWWELKQKL